MLTIDTEFTIDSYGAVDRTVSRYDRTVSLYLYREPDLYVEDPQSILVSHNFSTLI
jgi:hypothetical protein